jgi:hypothetical protein
VDNAAESAKSAAESAASAAFGAASAAWSVESAADSAVWSAAESAVWSAAESAARAAESAEFDYFADELLKIIAALEAPLHMGNKAQNVGIQP